MRFDKSYTTRFLGQKSYTLKVRKAQLLLLTIKQHKCIDIRSLGHFWVNAGWPDPMHYRLRATGGSPFRVVNFTPCFIRIPHPNIPDTISGDEWTVLNRNWGSSWTFMPVWNILPRKLVQKIFVILKVKFHHEGGCQKLLSGFFSLRGGDTPQFREGFLGRMFFR